MASNPAWNNPAASAMWVKSQLSTVPPAISAEAAM